MQFNVSQTPIYFKNVFLRQMQDFLLNSRVHKELKHFSKKKNIESDQTEQKTFNRDKSLKENTKNKRTNNLHSCFKTQNNTSLKLRRNYKTLSTDNWKNINEN